MSALFAIAMGCFILGVLVDLIFGVASKYARPVLASVNTIPLSLRDKT